MKKITIVLFISILAMNSFSQNGNSSANDNAQQIAALHNEKQKVVDEVLHLLSDNTTGRVAAVFNLPKGRYTLYAYLDNTTLKAAKMNARWQYGFGDSKQKSDRKIVYKNKGLLRKKDFIETNNISIENKYVEKEFIIKGHAAQNFGGGAVYKNEGKTMVTFYINKADIIGNYGGDIHILVYDKGGFRRMVTPKKVKVNIVD